MYYFYHFVFIGSRSVCSNCLVSVRLKRSVTVRNLKFQYFKNSYNKNTIVRKQASTKLDILIIIFFLKKH